MFLQFLSTFLLIFIPAQGSSAPAPPQSFRISGTVVDAFSGQLLSRTRVFLGSATQPDATQAVVTGEDGRFSFENLAPGKYRLSARRRGYLQQHYKQHEFFETAIVVGPGLATDALRFELRLGASISGQILDDSNEPVRHAQVILFRQGVRFGERRTRHAAQRASDDLGHYSFGHLAPGTYVVGVIAEPWYAQHLEQRRNLRLARDSTEANSGKADEADGASSIAALDVAYPATFFPNVTDISAASPFVLHAGDAETADITLHPVPAAHLVFRSLSGEQEQFNVRRITLHLADGLEEMLPVRTTASQGIAEVSGLPPGQVNVEWTVSKGEESTTHSQVIQLSSDSEISSSEATEWSAVTGTLRMDDGSPLPARTRLLFASPTTHRVEMAQTDSNGEFTLESRGLGAGMYNVSLEAPAMFIKSMSASGAKISGGAMEIAAGQIVRLTVIAVKGSGAVSGFTFKDGKPFDGVMVVLVPQDPEHNTQLFRRDESDSDGSFTLGAVPPGKYTLVAIENGWDLEWTAPGVLQKYLAGGESVQVQAGDKLQFKLNVQQ